MKRKNKKGFTLIELLIVIIIIGILMTLGINSYMKLQKNGRDAKRMSDLSKIQSALEQYHADQFYYPISIDSGISFTVNGVTKTYLSQTPADPVSSNSQYCYFPSPTLCVTSETTPCTGYRLFAMLENVNAGSGSCGDIATYNYLVSPP